MVNAVSPANGDRSVTAVNRKFSVVNAFSPASGEKSSTWQKAYYDHALRGDEDIQDVARYIVGNPLRANLVTGIGDYPHWDAVWL